MMPFRRLATAFVLAFSAAAAEAQTDRATHGCFRGAPQERCTGFPLIEAGAFIELNNATDDRLMLNGNLGFMINNGPRTALGGVVFLTIENPSRAGAGLRWRRWLGSQTSLDVGAGLNLVSEDGHSKVSAGSPTVQARLNYGDLIAGTARLDVLRMPCAPDGCSGTGMTSTRLYVGAEFGSYPGIAATVLLFLAMLSIPGT